MLVAVIFRPFFTAKTLRREEHIQDYGFLSAFVPLRFVFSGFYLPLSCQAEKNR